ncbi:MAG TPA: F0F1 ATP synthase subunit A [Thermotogota bacterium]|nr:F0F1 ATP synthase subunit A [Thermotogota bacterium]HPJ89129.1 F0F1 ATP synthase subunit A [Thermotogota bacterium]HPR96764.1 F0F1 ATP synthase subunit A [Thermotogota bacterium]
MSLSKGEKIFVGLLLLAIVVVWFFALPNIGGMDQLKEMGIGTKWIYTFGDQAGFFTRINWLTVIIGGAIVLGVILFARSIGKKYSMIPDKRQAGVEMFLDYMHTTVEDSITVKEYVKPVFIISTTLFIFIAVSNVISGIPGLNVSVINGKPHFTLFLDTWYTPTSDLNTNATYAIMTLLISYAFAIKVKGLKAFLKSFFEPTPIMFPMNLVGEIAKPISHSLRLFGNIYGGGILVLILSYMVKYLIMPVALWGFFGMFIGIIQAMVFSMLTIAYIAGQIE